jgi:hypothetical protein
MLWFVDVHYYLAGDYSWQALCRRVWAGKSDTKAKSHKTPAFIWTASITTRVLRSGDGADRATLNYATIESTNKYSRRRITLSFSCVTERVEGKMERARGSKTTKSLCEHVKFNWKHFFPFFNFDAIGGIFIHLTLTLHCILWTKGTIKHNQCRHTS